MFQKNLELAEENDALKLEVKTLSKIKEDQSSALQALSEQTEYVAKIKSLSENARMYKERAKELEETLIHERKGNKGTFERLRHLQEQNEKLKAKIAPHPKPPASPLDCCIAALIVRPCMEQRRLHPKN